MGVIALYLVDYVVEVSLLLKCLATRIVSSNSLTITYLSLLLLFYSLSGARSALPMGVAPEAIAEKFFPGIGSKGYKFFLEHSIPFLFPLKS
jgi:hypothetical protein